LQSIPFVQNVMIFFETTASACLNHACKTNHLHSNRHSFICVIFLTDLTNENFCDLLGKKKNKSKSQK